MLVLLLTSSLIRGFQQEIREKVFGFWGHIQVEPVDMLNDNQSASLMREAEMENSIKTIKWDDVAAFKDHDQVGSSWINKSLSGQEEAVIEQLAPYIRSQAILSSKKYFEGVVVKGIDPLSYDFSFFKQYLSTASDSIDLHQLKQDEVILSATIANGMELELGDRVLISFILNNREIKKRLNVKAIYKTGLEEYDNNLVVCTMGFLQSVLDWTPAQVTGYEIRVSDLEDVEYINDVIYYNILPPQLFSETVVHKSPIIFDWLDFQKINERVLFVVMLVVAFVNLLTVLLILILERVQMVGLFKALGSGNALLRWIFVFLGSRIVLQGMFWGNLAAIVLIYLQDRYHFITLDESAYYLSYAPVSFNLGTWLFINLLVLLLLVLFMLLPTVMIRHLTPMQSLTYS